MGEKVIDRYRRYVESLLRDAEDGDFDALLELASEFVWSRRMIVRTVGVEEVVRALREGFFKLGEEDRRRFVSMLSDLELGLGEDAVRVLGVILGLGEGEG